MELVWDSQWDDDSGQCRNNIQNLEKMLTLVWDSALDEKPLFLCLNGPLMLKLILRGQTTKQKFCWASHFEMFPPVSKVGILAIKICTFERTLNAWNGKN